MAEPRFSKSLCWFRRDLRLEDQTALSLALEQSEQVYCAFIFDTDILDALAGKQDRRVEFIWHCVDELRVKLEQLGGGLHVLHGKAETLVPGLAKQLGVEAVFCNRDYEPNACKRDQAVAAQLKLLGIDLYSSKDQVIFEGAEILNGKGTPYAVFTPYKHAWLKRLSDSDYHGHDTRRLGKRLARQVPLAMPGLKDLGFLATDLLRTYPYSGATGAMRLFDDFAQRIDRYRETRDFPGIKGGSYLSPHLRFGTISIRRLVGFCHERRGEPGVDTYLSELIWREFYQMLLSHFPGLAEGHSFKPVFEHLAFSNDGDRFEKWKQGQTGYPLIDAGMRQLGQTGFMHNRLRMLTASFLVKELDVDWRWGERHFAELLLDFDLASNNGGWQWAASTGCDAQPWFRIFNPVTQSQKFDPHGKFIRRYVPELTHVPDEFIHAPWRMNIAQQQVHQCRIGTDYPAPLVEHSAARAIALQRYSAMRPR